MKKRILATAAALSGLALLTACGGGGNGTTATGTQQNPQNFSGPNDSLATRISEAGTLQAATTFTAKTVGLNHSHENGEPSETVFADPQDMAVRMFRASADPGTPPTVVVALDGGGPVTFMPEHAGDRNWRFPGTGNHHIPNESPDDDGNGEADARKWFWTWDGYPLDHANGFDWEGRADGKLYPKERKHHVALGYFATGEPEDMRRLAVIGLHTAPDDMPTHSVRAVYEGSPGLRRFPQAAESALASLRATSASSPSSTAARFPARLTGGGTGSTGNGQTLTEALPT